MKKNVEITRNIVKEFIMEAPADFVDFVQSSYEAEVMAYLDHRSQQFDEWIASRLRGRDKCGCIR